jgi:CHASE3 domain sensor protein
MFGLEQFLDTFGTLTIAFVVEVIIAVVAVIIAYKKLRNKIIGSYKEREQQKEDIQTALNGIKNLPCETYKNKNIEVQEKLKNNDKEILDTCKKIQDGIDRNLSVLNERLDKLEDRERNALREKILHMHRMFTSVKRNPMQAWSEMERDSFNELIKDYESLNGNGHIHTVVIPDMARLRVILMTDTVTLAELFHSREA